MAERATLLDELGGEAGCKRLSTEFYARVGGDPILRPLFPGKTLRCAIEEFAAFLIQFLGGDEEQTQYRWWLSLRESHARFRIGPPERSAWLKQMRATLKAAQFDEKTRIALDQLFRHSSAYVMGKAVSAAASGRARDCGCLPKMVEASATRVPLQPSSVIGLPESGKCVPKTCPACNGSQQVTSVVDRTWWQILLLRPKTKM